jgi:hypothetical protein
VHQNREMTRAASSHARLPQNALHRLLRAARKSQASRTQTQLTQPTTLKFLAWRNRVYVAPYRIPSLQAGSSRRLRAARYLSLLRWTPAFLPRLRILSSHNAFARPSSLLFVVISSAAKRSREISLCFTPRPPLRILLNACLCSAPSARHPFLLVPESADTPASISLHLPIAPRPLPVIAFPGAPARIQPSCRQHRDVTMYTHPL